ncbi:hypothetical protein PQX77_008350 [Marasmius sp. AFHP31]|nr:hypothetical protein PQX77_008350 [Marasmius sp. AFHP31]
MRLVSKIGSLTAGKGNRLVLANTEELHDRIEGLCGRIRELEAALRVLQMQVSDEPHPLLTPDLLQLKAPQTNGNNKAQQKTLPATSSETQSSSSGASSSASPPEQQSQEMDEDELLVDAFGTLSIGANGESTFLGKTARSEFLIRALSKPPASEEVECPRISEKIRTATCTDSDKDPEAFGNELLSMLPSLSEAIRLCEVYLEHGKYLIAYEEYQAYQILSYPPVPRAELFDDVLAMVYRAGDFSHINCHHSVALLFSVFSLASLFDTTRTPYNVEAQEYFYLARATVGINPVMKRTTLRMIQTTLHLAQYLELSDWQALGTNSALPVAGHAVRLAVSVGLHLNSSRWKLPEQVQQQRNRVFWSLFANDTWMSFSYGRPPNISPVYVDCPLPKDTEEFVNPEGQKETGFHSWIWQYSAFMHSIMEGAFGCTVPTYAKIVEFDRKIRDFPVSLHLRVCCANDMRPDILMQKYMVLCYKETTLLHLHRAYFAQALLDSPHDLTNHRFVPSVMATYRSAWRLIQGLKQAWEKAPQLVSRYNLAWSQALSAAIVMCILITRAPNSKMTSSSLKELDDVSKLFEEAAPTCRSASTILDTILVLQRKAHVAVDQTPTPPDPNRCEFNLTPAELDRLGGRTQLVSPRENNHTGTSNKGSPLLNGNANTNGNEYINGTSDTHSSPTDILNGVRDTIMAEQGIQNMHPIIAQDMRSLDSDSLESSLLDLYDPPGSNSMGTLNLGASLDHLMDHNNFGGVGMPDQGQDLFGSGAISSSSSGMFNAMAYPPTNGGTVNGTGLSTGQPGFGVNVNGAPILDATWQSFVEQLGF